MSSNNNNDNRNKKDNNKNQNDPFKEFHNPDNNQKRPNEVNSNNNKNDSNKKDNQEDYNKNDGNDDEKKKKILATNILILASFGILHLLSRNFRGEDNSMTEGGATTSWNEFVNLMLAKGEVEELIAFKEREVIYIKLYPNAIVNGQQV